MTKEQFFQRSEYFEARLTACLRATKEFRARDLELSKPGAMEEFEKLQKEACQASNDWFNFCEDNRGKVV